MVQRRRIAILGGTGPLGRGLGVRFARAGHVVILGSREAARAEAVAQEVAAAAGADVTGDANARAVEGADVVVVAVPADGLDATLSPLADVLADAVVVSTVNALDFDAHGPLPGRVAAASAAEHVQDLLPEARVVAAFQHVSAPVLRDADRPLDADVLVVGDDDDACRLVAGLADDIAGTRGLVVGPLRLARPIEDLTAVIISANKLYGAHAGIRLTGIADREERT